MSVDRLVRLGEYAQEHVGLRVMRVDLSRRAAIPMSDQLRIVEHLKGKQPGGSGCDRATWVQTELARHVLDNF